MAVSAEKVLREMAGRALQRLERGRRSASDGIDRSVLLRTTSELQATATVLVLLDLIAEERAEQLLSAHRRSLDELGVSERGVSVGELTLRSTSAYGFQAARRRQLGSLRHRPLSVAAPAAHAALLDFDLGIDWLVVAPGGVRGRGTISTSDGHLLPTSDPEMSVPFVDDGGQPYGLLFTGGSRARWISRTAPPDSASTGA